MHNVNSSNGKKLVHQFVFKLLYKIGSSKKMEGSKTKLVQNFDLSWREVFILMIIFVGQI